MIRLVLICLLFCVCSSAYALNPLELTEQAQKGDPESQYNLAKFYLDPSTFVDKEKGLFWLLKSAEQGHFKSQALLIETYEGDAKIEDACNWANTADTNTNYKPGNAADKLLMSQVKLFLGKAYGNNLCGSKDTSKADLYFQESVKLGNIYAESEFKDFEMGKSPCEGVFKIPCSLKNKSECAALNQYICSNQDMVGMSRKFGSISDGGDETYSITSDCGAAECSGYILEKIDGTYKTILSYSGPTTYLKNISNGHHDIKMYTRENSYGGSVTSYSYNGAKYEIKTCHEISSRQVDDFIKTSDSKKYKGLLSYKSSCLSKYDSKIINGKLVEILKVKNDPKMMSLVLKDQDDTVLIFFNTIYLKTFKPLINTVIKAHWKQFNLNNEEPENASNSIMEISSIDTDKSMSRKNNHNKNR